MPKTLFNALAIRHPEITIAISRMIATRSFKNTRIDPFQNGAASGNNNMNLKTVAILPVSGTFV